MTDNDRRRLVETASKIRRSVRHPDLIALCDRVLAMVAECHVTVVTECRCPFRP
jgi:hypothetical protein